MLLVGGGAAWAGLPLRLNQSQWTAYQKVNAPFREQTPKSVARFRYCLSKTTGLDARAMAKCFGNSADRELTATENLSAQLHKFERRTAGPCNSSLTGYQYQLRGWRSVITGVQRSVHRVGNAATIVTQAQLAALVYPKVAKSAAAFAAACKPRS
jgi:hypothetical protein